jgi:predicted TIM-barrel fold metal-dependent hydrolase
MGLKLGAVALLMASAAAAARPPIIDMHLHARRLGSIAGAPLLCAPPTASPRWDNRRPIAQGLKVPGCAHPLKPSASGEQVMRETVAILARHNIIAMASGEPEDLARWRAAAPERIIAGLDLRIVPRPPSARFQARSPAEVRALYAAGDFQLLGEVMTQYEGVAPDDARLEPYWALAEELDIPVAIHMGPGAGGDAYFDGGAYRVRDGSALRLEEVLVRHPRLRVSIMHAGYPMIDDLLALLGGHPQVYVDIAAIVATEPRAAFYRYLRQIVEAGYGDRVMFGTDQGVWPELIEVAIRTIQQAPFLNARQKRDIFYDNAARFLRLTPAQIARHRRM